LPCPSFFLHSDLRERQTTTSGGEVEDLLFPLPFLAARPGEALRAQSSRTGDGAFLAERQNVLLFFSFLPGVAEPSPPPPQLGGDPKRFKDCFFFSLLRAAEHLLFSSRLFPLSAERILWTSPTQRQEEVAFPPPFPRAFSPTLLSFETMVLACSPGNKKTFLPLFLRLDATEQTFLSFEDRILPPRNDKKSPPLG